MNAGFSDNFAHFNTQMARYVDDLGMAAPVVVWQQAGLLARTLIQLTPPRDPEKARDKVERDINGVFGQMTESFKNHGSNDDSPKHGYGDVYWYHWDDQSLTGKKKLNDSTGADVESLRLLYYKMKSRPTTGNIQYVGTRGKQGVYIKEQFLVNPTTQHQLIRHLRENVGRLKAGWLPGWKAAGSPAGSAGAVPVFVTRHDTGARGYVVDGLGIKGCPAFTMANYAAGARASTLGRIMVSALNLRAKAMMADILLYVRGVKKVGGEQIQGELWL